MPYAAADRQDFIRRMNLKPEARILDLGGMLADELPLAVSGLTKPRQLNNAVLIRPALLPFKNLVFDAVVSYHYLDLISPEMLTYVFPEILRVLKSGSMFSFMITLWSAQNDQQRSSLLFSGLLKRTGALHSHEFENINMQLSTSGFAEITVETIKRGIPIPKNFTMSHLKMLGNLIKKEKDEGGKEIRVLTKQYFEHVNKHGEAMLPALHFIAQKP